MYNDKNDLDTNLPKEHFYSLKEVLSSIVFVFLTVIGMYFLSNFLK